MFSARSLPSFRAPDARPVPDGSIAIGANATSPVRNSAIVTFVSAFIFLTSGLFALSLKPLPAAIVILGCASGTWLIASRPSGKGALGEQVHWRRLTFCFALATILMLLGGETHLFYANPDWHIRDAVLSDLVQHGMATVYRVGDADYILRAPLGMYVVPSLVGRLFGLMGAHVAMLVQNALFLGATLYLLLSTGRGWRHLAIVVLFAGLVIVPDLLRIALTPATFRLTTVFDAWIPFWQYSSSMLQFFWVPNHALPGWWLATLLLVGRRHGIDDATLGVSVAGLVLWSPLAIVPVIPWLLYRAVTDWRAVFLSSRIWSGVAVAACFTPVLVYLVQGSETIAHGNAAAVPDLGFWYSLFVFVQLPAFGFCLVFWRHVPPAYRALLVASGLLLLLLPAFSFGPSNDLARRGSIAALTIIGFIFGDVVLDLAGQRKAGAIVGLVLIIATLPSATNEILRAIMLPPAPISACTLMEAANAFDGQRLPTNYVVAEDSVPTWLFEIDAKPIIAMPGRTCSRDTVTSKPS